MSQHAPNCRQCEHFQVTWDNANPQGCNKFGFKTRQMPSVEILATTGKQCSFFTSKLEQGQQVFRFQRPAVLPDHCTFSITG